MKAKTWVEVLTNFVELCYDLDDQSILKLTEKIYQNIKIFNNKIEMTKPKEIGNSGIFYETNRSANDIISMTKVIIEKLNLDFREFEIYILESFDINNKNT